jgi:hypothetical protein
MQKVCRYELVAAMARGVAKLQIHRSVFLPCEHQRIRHEGDKLCDAIYEI